MTRFVVGAALVLASAPPAGAQAEPGPRWELVADVPLPGPASRLDYQSLDTIAGRLWIAHMGAGEVLAFDVRSRKVVARVPGLRGATGVLAVPALGRVFVSLSGAGEVAVLDAATGRLIARVPGGRFPDGIDYAPGAGKLYVSDEHGRQETVIDAAAGIARPPIPLGGEAGNTRYDPVSGRIWVAVQTRGELVSIDPAGDSITARIPVPGVERPHGFQIDPAHGRAYVTGEGNGRLVVVDLRTGKAGRPYAVGEEPDVVALDAGRARLYVASESGAVAAFDIRGDSLLPLARYQAPHAHSVAVDPATHFVYLPLESIGGRPVLRILRLE